MLSRLKRRAPSASSSQAELDNSLDSSFDNGNIQSDTSSMVAPTSPTLSAKSRRSAAAAAAAGQPAASGARTLSPSRAGAARQSRSSSFGSFVERPSVNKTTGDSRFLVVKASKPDAASLDDIGQGSLSLDHLSSIGDQKTLLVQAPELLNTSDGFIGRDLRDDTEARTPVAPVQERHLLSSDSHFATRPRSNTTLESTSMPSGLSALASINTPEGHGHALLGANQPGIHQSSSLPGSQSMSRSVSRSGSRSSSINRREGTDATASLRPPTTAVSNKPLKKSKSSQSNIGGATAVVGSILASPAAAPRQSSSAGRNSADSYATQDGIDTESDAMSIYGESGLLSIDQLGDFDDVASQLGTGFAVASSKRNADFHAIFRHIPDDDYLIEDYGCALQREILIQGRLYISEHHLSFNANIFGWVTTLTIPFAEVVTIEKRMTAYVIPNAIQVTTLHARHTFASFLSRDTTYDLIGNIWRMIHPVVPTSAALPDSAFHDTDDDADDANANDSVDESDQQTSKRGGKRRLRGLRRRGDTADSSSAPDRVGSHIGAAGSGAAGANGDSPRTTPRADLKIHAATVDTCPTLKNLKEVCMDVVFPSAPEKIYNLMFTSGFMKDFWSENQKLLDLQISDWAPAKSGSNLLARSMSYIKPLTAPIGPKQTKCVITDENAHVDFDDFVCVITTTRTPDVPSGTAFAVKTRTSLTWTRNNSCRVVVTTGVEWSKSSFIKGIVERSCIEGQKSYHADLEKAMRAYIAQHRSEFLEEGQDADATAAPESASGESLHESGFEQVAQGGGATTTNFKQSLGPWGMIRSFFDALSDLGISASSSALGFVVVVLVLSNLWTLGGRPSSSTRQGLGSVGGSQSDRTPDQVALAVRDVLRDYFDAGSVGNSATVNPSRTTTSSIDARQEAADIAAILDDLERRLTQLREGISSVDERARGGR